MVQQFWDALAANTLRGSVSFTHNTYLKLFVLEVVATGAQLKDDNGRPYDAMLIDEGQDMNGVTKQLLLSQRCHQVWVGDPHQHINSFNFCSNALQRIAAMPGVQRYTLSQSFRLGPAPAEVANRCGGGPGWLGVLGWCCWWW